MERSLCRESEHYEEPYSYTSEHSGLIFAALYGPEKVYDVVRLPRGPLLLLVTTFLSIYNCRGRSGGPGFSGLPSIPPPARTNPSCMTAPLVLI